MEENAYRVMKHLERLDKVVGTYQGDDDDEQPTLVERVEVIEDRLETHLGMIMEVQKQLVETCQQLQKNIDDLKGELP